MNQNVYLEFLVQVVLIVLDQSATYRSSVDFSWVINLVFDLGLCQILMWKLFLLRKLGHMLSSTFPIGGLLPKMTKTMP